jgi:hypothetical protein
MTLATALRLSTVLAATLFGACTDSTAVDDDLAGLATTFDSLGDTIVARVEGTVASAALRTLQPELRIAPTEEDTSLFGEVFDMKPGRDGRVWAFDPRARTMFLFDSTGRLERRIGRQGSGPGEFANSSGINVLPDGRVGVWDSQNARISFFSAGGDYLQSWSHASGFNTSNGLVSDGAGTIYVTRPVAAPGEYDTFWKLGLVQLDSTGTWVDSLVPPVVPVKRPEWQAQSTDGNSRNSTTVRYGAGGHWRWHPDGFFVTADGARYTITLHRAAAKPLRIERRAEPVPVGADEQANEREIITHDMRRTNPAWSWTGDALVATKAPLLGIQLTRDGRVWARVSLPSERIPDSELDPPSSDGRPQRRYRETSPYEVFARDGRFLGRITMPPNTTLMEAEGDVVWAITRDEVGLPALMRYRVVPSLSDR